MGKLRRSFVVDRDFRTRWSGGKIVKVSNSLFASVNEVDVFLINPLTNETEFILKAENESEDRVHDVVVDSSLKFAVTSHESMLLKLWIADDGEWEVAAQWKCPGRFPPSLAISFDGTMLVCATPGQSCYFFALQTQKLVQRFEIPKGLITALTYDVSGNLWIGDNMGHVTVINKTKNTVTRIPEESSHKGQVSAIVSVPPLVVTSGTDEVIWVYNTDVKQHRAPIGAMYSISHMIADPSHPNCVLAATPDGVKRYNIVENKVVSLSKQPTDQLFYFDRLYSLSTDGFLTSVKTKDSLPPRVVSLSMHEIYDSAYDDTTNTITFATSSNSLVGYNNGTPFKLTGHTGTPLCLASQNGLLISGSQDTTARIWSLEEQRLLTTLEGHANAVTAVAFVPKSDCVLTASQDTTLRLWRPTTDEFLRSALCMTMAHEKEINCIDVSLDGTVVATASRDKTAKLWSLQNDRLTLIREYTGHKGYLWAVAFSPVEKILATSGRDGSIKLWSVTDGSCISTFTEFRSPVTRMKFITNGLQIAATESSGAFKIVRVKTGTIDFYDDEAHDGKIFALSTAEDGAVIVTGGEDGVGKVWRDNTEELEAEELARKAEMTESDQALKNALRNGEYIEALKLAFKLRLPHKLRLVVREITEKDYVDAMDDYFQELEDPEDVDQWLEYTAKWATNSKWADDATSVISSLLRSKSLKYFTDNKKVFKSKIQGIIPYLKRHASRLDRLHIQTYIIDHIVDTFHLQ